ncbi:MAG: LuxR C-terminal-related transcriptional regulator [Pseudomonadota bacterium]
MNNTAFNRLRSCEVRTYAGGKDAHNLRGGICSGSDIIHNLLSATSVQAVHAQCLLICENYGFDFFSIIEYVVRPTLPPLLYRMLQHVDSFAAHYEKHGLIFDDPGIQIATRLIHPYVISHDVLGFEFTSNQMNVINTSVDFGLRQVFNAPFHDHLGGCGLVRFVHKEGGRTSTKERANLFAIHSELFLLSSYVHSALTQLLRTGESAVLSEREKEVLKWIAVGANTARIGDFMMISENTVCNHLKNIRVKLGVKNTAHAVAKALVERMITI